MELLNLETNLQLETARPLNARVLRILINLNPCLAEDEALLLSYYKRVRATWSNSAIKTVQKATGLKLTNKLNRCQFAIEAAKQELLFIQTEIESVNCYLDPDQLPVNSSQTSLELPEVTSFQIEELEREENQQKDIREQLQIAEAQIKELEWQLKEKQEQLNAEKQQLEQSKNFSMLLLANRLLSPGLPLNGTEESPAMRILGSPKTLTEL